MHRTRTAVTSAIAVSILGMTGVAVASPSAGASTAKTATSNGGKINRYNEGATHSPQLEGQQSGPAVAPGAAARVRSAALAAPAAAASESTPSAVEGIDVASLQHPNGAAINWPQVAGDGYKFVFIKVSEGSYYTNPYYAGDASGATSAGMFAAPYAFAIPNYSGGALQADYALDHAGFAGDGDGRTLPLILDLEQDPYAPPLDMSGDGTNACYGLTPSQLVAWIGAFVTEADRRTGQLPVIYINQSWWDTCTGDSAAFTADPLWIANYGVTTPAVPAAWTGDWTYWQYTDGSTSPPTPPPPPPPGMTVQTDLSWLSSTALELAALGNQTDQNRGSAVSRQVNVLDGGGPVTFSATGLPPGLSMDATKGAVTGPTGIRITSFPVSVTASAPGDASVTQTFTWAVHGPVALGALPSRTGSVGSPVHYQVPAADGLGGCTLRFSASGLPHGLTISSCGLISGWPSVGGGYTVHVSVTDSSGAVRATGSFRWTIARASGGPAGHIQLSRDGKCLAALSGTDIAIETCSAAAQQLWTIAADGSIRVNGACLAATAATSSAAGKLSLTSCNGRQRWQLGSNAVLTYVSDGNCLADTGARNGARAIAAPCKAAYNNTGSASTPSSSQQWTLPAGPLTSGIAGYCASNVRAPGQRIGGVTLRSCSGTSSQAWTLKPDGAVSIGGKCLGLIGGATAPGTRVRLFACNGSADQTWQLTGGPIGVQVFSPVAGLCLADPGDLAVSATPLAIGPCVAGDPGIAWRVS
jgi:GH25 family lysozyme M1 (1,4-beta-N-acetylmuramidase)